MLKSKISPTPVDENRQAIADFLGLDYLAVVPNEAPGSYSINISDNPEAQAKYKESYPYGNTFVPKRFDFSGQIDVQWTGKKIMPA